ncbi:MULTISPECIES: enoyl-CoA hydratase-related protein [Microbacterium]|uniref:enoyl-CoA hydratase-related protein n=1 Tax=Microbacterium TaxID=33882 RepID=UPI002783F42A|nr:MULTISPECIES: enoyl-CoA hydratase-related protein [Microbacterium]MDQ1075233.1 enoyl-CoA hydratase [Microbacterium sp. SORGH_AS_0969]MDQ1115464.1 enoyl-CoA hydratase [Microbacterium testaceum]
MSGVRQHIDGAVATVTLDRAEKRNALDAETLGALVDALRRLDDDPTVRAIVIAGDERAFAAGADLGDLGSAGAVELYRSGFSEHWDAVAAIRTPLVAAVRGYALGGGLELALACDVVVIAADAVLGFPEVRLGILPGAGGTQRLLRAVGKTVALDLLLTARRIDGAEAARLGIASRVVASAEVEGAARAAADEIAQGAPVAAAMIKSAVLAGFEMPLGAAVAHERALSALIAASADRAEGMRAFGARETPTFEGR